MRTPSAVTLLPLLRSRAQGDILALLYLHPDRAYSLSDVARRTRVSVKTVHQEANRLVEAGLLREERLGNNRMLRAVTDSLLTRPLTDLFAVTYGPLPVLTDALRGVPGIERALIYGSWAARYRGEPGPPPDDVDVLVIGDADPDDLDEAVEPARRLLRREINVRRIPGGAWTANTTDPFLQSVQSRPLVELSLDDAA